jgi:hypothetical protein
MLVTSTYDLSDVMELLFETVQVQMTGLAD